MSDDKSQYKDEGTNKKHVKHKTRIVYHRCQICGGRKKEEDMINNNNCKDCLERHIEKGQQNPPFKSQSFWGTINVRSKK